jgi:opacity protein-like surface antigen
MKKLIACVGAAALLMTAAHAANVNYFAADLSSVTIGESEWMKSESQTWTGMHNSVKTWYKVNTKDASIWWSTDGKAWEMVKDGMWQDKEGKWLKISESKLMWSADGGKTWVEVPDWTWQDADGMWCKFDKDWTLWTKKG